MPPDYSPPTYPRKRPHSTLEEIEKRSRALLAKGAAARFVDTGEDSKEVAKLIERLREAISYYQASGCWIIASGIAYTGGQISQQQGIYDQITNLTVRILRFVLTCRSDGRLFPQVVFWCSFEISRGNAGP